MIWRKGIDIVKQVYIISQGLPKDEIFGLSNQIKRCSESIPSNIAEGYGRGSTQDYIRFLRMARGSIYELETQLHLIEELNLSNQKEIIEITNSLLIEESKMLNAMIISLSAAKTSS